MLAGYWMGFEGNDNPTEAVARFIEKHGYAPEVPGIKSLGNLLLVGPIRGSESNESNQDSADNSMPIGDYGPLFAVSQDSGRTDADA